jgi:hypothetical protein
MASRAAISIPRDRNARRHVIFAISHTALVWKLSRLIATLNMVSSSMSRDPARNHSEIEGNPVGTVTDADEEDHVGSAGGVRVAGAL